MIWTGRRAYLVVLLVAGCSKMFDGDAFQPDRDPQEDVAEDPDVAAAADAGPEDEENAADVCGETCPGGDCDLRCPDRPCECELDCASTFKTCKSSCNRHDCAIDCREVDKCEVSCKSQDASCEIDCAGARECDHVKCEGGAECLLFCADTEKCDFEDCQGEITSCPGDVLACNRACP